MRYLTITSRASPVMSCSPALSILSLPAAFIDDKPEAGRSSLTPGVLLPLLRRLNRGAERPSLSRCDRATSQQEDMRSGAGRDPGVLPMVTHASVNRAERGCQPAAQVASLSPYLLLSGTVRTRCPTAAH
jgi:hypothetical protein